jgi:hypothetical protein
MPDPCRFIIKRAEMGLCEWCGHDVRIHGFQPLGLLYGSILASMCGAPLGRALARCGHDEEWHFGKKESWAGCIACPLTEGRWHAFEPSFVSSKEPHA